MEESTHVAAGSMRDHWWYRGRRRLVKSLLDRFLQERHGGTVLDFGCGTGHMGSVLARYGVVWGMESSRVPLEVGCFTDYERTLLGSDSELADLRGHGFALITCLDVLEHVEDDAGLLGHLRDALADDGIIVISVPMDPRLFCEVDERAGHKRRYTREAIRILASDADLRVVHETGYVVALLPIAAAHRRRVRAGKADAGPELDVPWQPVNVILSCVALIEGSLARWLRLPRGLSRFFVLEKAPLAKADRFVSSCV